MHNIHNPEFRARLYRQVDIDLFPNPITGTPCWTWKGARTKAGYGVITISHNNSIHTHRAAFLIEGGTIPPGKELHHTCCNNPCCNPQHLAAVTHQENCRRGLSAYHNTRHRPHQRPSDKRTLQLPFGS